MPLTGGPDLSIESLASPAAKTTHVRAQRNDAPIRVLAAPGFAFAHLNPYGSLLYGELVRLGVKVEEFTLFRPFYKRFDILHLHWPEYYVAQKNPLKALLGSVVLLLGCAWSRWRGARVIWTVHNTLSHNQPHPRGERFFWRALTRLLDGYICLTERGRREVQELHPILRHLPSYVIPHGHYRGAYPRRVSREAARLTLGIAENAKVILLLGTIARYKNVLELVKVFRQLPDPDLRLMVAGICPDPGLKKSLIEAAGPDARIELNFAFVPKEQVQILFRASDLVALPFREILNSGSALLALSFDRPVLVPARGAMPELQREMGPEWVRLFSGDLTATELGRALEWAVAGQRGQSPPMEHLDWAVLAADTLRAFEAVAADRISSHART